MSLAFDVGCRFEPDFGPVVRVAEGLVLFFISLCLKVDQSGLFVVHVDGKHVLLIMRRVVTGIILLGGRFYIRVRMVSAFGRTVRHVRCHGIFLGLFHRGLVFRIEFGLSSLSFELNCLQIFARKSL